MPDTRTAAFDFASRTLPAWPERGEPGIWPPAPTRPPVSGSAPANGRLPAVPSAPAPAAPATAAPPPAAPPPAASAPAASAPAASAPAAPYEGETPDFTDADLRAALLPVLTSAAPGADSSTEDLITRLEPLLRAAIRRALAEAHPASHRPFRAPGLWDRFRWRIAALLTSRTYGEVVFEKTRRFQVEEVFLLDPRTLAMISYASNDPARHAHPPRVHGTAKRLARQIKDPRGGIVAAISLPEQRTALTVPGQAALLVAITRGTANDLLLSDLAFCLSRIEARFQGRLHNATDPLLTEIQPFLEDCLLIQAPPAA